MRNPTKILTASLLALAVAVPLSLSAQQAYSASTPDTAQVAQPSPGQQALQKFSQAGDQVFSNVRAARYALVNGHPDMAKKLLDEAKTALGEARKDQPTLETTTAISVGGKLVENTTSKDVMKYVPVDSKIWVSEDVTLSKDVKDRIDKANAHVKAGNRDKAMDELRPAAIDVNITHYWLPLDQTGQNLDKAISLSGDGKFYEANLALKAIEDSVQMESVISDSLM
ncbi:MAG: YfdX family protein [Rhodobacterales bacterium]|nr:YfdX family protein [Rhodobacterales bacterium]